MPKLQSLDPNCSDGHVLTSKESEKVEKFTPARDTSWPPLPGKDTNEFTSRRANALRLQRLGYTTPDAFERYVSVHPHNQYDVKPGDSRLIPPFRIPSAILGRHERTCKSGPIFIFE